VVRFTFSIAVICLQLFVSAQLPGQETGYLVLKNSSGKIFGKLLEKDAKDPDTGKSILIVETESGGRIEVDRSQATWQPADDLLARYETELAKATESSESHWTLAQWCLAEKGGRTKLGQQIDYHLLEAIRLDPQHAEARKELERREWKNVGGRWMPEAQFFSNLGFLYEDGRWVSQLQSRINKILADREAKIGQLKSQFVKWKQQLPNYDAGQAITQLRAFADELLVPILDKEAQDEKLNDPAMRRVYLEVIGQIPCTASQQSLIRFYLADSDLGLRERAKDILLSPEFDGEKATRFGTAGIFIGTGALDPTKLDNERLQSHAAFLGELGTVNAILPLIKIVETVHKISVGPDPGRMQLQQSNQGTGLQTGGKQQIIEKHFVNQKVINALRSITKANPGESAELWRRWYLDNFTLAHHSIGADE
jgi:hypothetical protein